MNSFLTISAASEGLYKEKGSRFIGLAYPVTSEDEVKNILEELRKEHHKARHICYAYRLGSDMSHHKSSDAGEPPNTAGPPIMNQIRSLELTNILVVVVRYFGGTKLGVSGLIQAYKAAAADVLQNAGIITDFEKETVEAETNYESLNEIMNFIKTKNVHILNQEFGEQCRILMEVAKEEAILVRTYLSGLKNTTVLA